MSEIAPNIAIGVGFMRCGTSWLNHILFQHPEINKEKSGLHYFNYNYDRGKSWYLGRLIDSQFKINVDFSTTYSFVNSMSVVSRIVNDFPEAKIIFSIRNPKDRALSDFRRLIRKGYIDCSLSFEKALMTHQEIIERSCYSGLIKLYLDSFPRANIHIVNFDSIERNPRKVASDIYQFLGVDPDFSDLDLEKKGGTYSFKSHYLEMLLSKFQRKTSCFFNKALSPSINRLVRKRGRSLVKTVRKFNEASSENSLIPSQVSKKFDQEVVELENLIGLKLDYWKSTYE